MRAKSPIQFSREGEAAGRRSIEGWPIAAIPHPKATNVQQHLIPAQTTAFATSQSETRRPAASSARWPLRGVVNETETCLLQNWLRACGESVNPGQHLVGLTALITDAPRREVDLPAPKMAPSDEGTAGLTVSCLSHSDVVVRGIVIGKRMGSGPTGFGRQRTGPPECRCGGKCSPLSGFKSNRSILLPLRNRLNRLGPETLVASAARRMRDSWRERPQALDFR